jgi:hypothetical protein
MAAPAPAALPDGQSYVRDTLLTYKSGLSGENFTVLNSQGIEYLKDISCSAQISRT